MPPDENALRQRVVDADSRKVFLAAAGTDVDNHDETRTATEERIVSTKGLSSDEICIDGVIYNIAEFDHPGGDSIRLFGGNDVTVQYKMIHPYHSTKHLEKMKRVGTVPDYHCEYKFDTPFARELKKEVFNIVHRGREFGTYGWHFRAICYVSLFVVLQYFWVMRGSSYVLAVAFGVSMALIGLNVQHDANHGAASRNPRVNEFYGLGADLIGNSNILWQEQHWQHHAYTRTEKDPDGFAGEPFLIFSDYPPADPRRMWHHRFQAYFHAIITSFYWVSVIFSPDVLKLQHSGAGSVGIRMESRYIKSRVKYALALRLVYIYLNLLTPFRQHSFGTALGHVVTMGCAGSLLLSLLFTLSHNFEGVEEDPFQGGGADVRDEPICWFKSQVETSSTYGGFVSGCLTGGLNFQVEHHLFPRMSSSWYPYIAPAVREVCRKHNVRYVYYPWVWQNFWSTMRYLQLVGRGGSINTKSS